MDKNTFSELKNLKKEYKDLTERLETEKNKTITVFVPESKRQYPYNKHLAEIQGYKNPNRIKKLKRMLKNKQKDIDKKIINIEYQLNYVEDAEIRTIIRYRYIDGLNYNQIAQKLNDGEKEYTADSIRMKLNRFFEKTS